MARIVPNHSAFRKENRLGGSHRKVHAGSAPIAGGFFDKSVTVRVSTLTALLVPLLAFAQHAPPCVYKPQRWDDGDSFHVILPDQTELIFRLYFVDTPEEERVYADRIADHAANPQWQLATADEC
jgi:endonuclease YncB( thermonuclease family)